MMVADWVSPITIVDERLLGCNFDLKEAQEDAVDANLRLSINYSAEHQSEGSLRICRIVLQVSINGESEDSSEGVFEITTRMGMTISIDESCFGNEPEDEAERQMEANAVSLCFGKSRAFIQDLSARAHFGDFFVPAISPYELVKAAREQEE